MEVTVTDIRKRPIGAYFGGDYGASVPCPLCSKPGAKLVRRKHTEYVHVFTLSLNQKNEPELAETVTCKVPL